MAGKSLNFGIKLLRETEDPDLKKSIYGLIASVSTIMKQEIANDLSEITDYMITSIQSSEGIIVCKPNCEIYMRKDKLIVFMLFCF